MRSWTLRGFFASFLGKSAAFPAKKAAHWPFSGQAPQSGGPLGPHTVAPSSISAWVKSPGHSAGYTVSKAALARFFTAGSLMGAGSAKKRDSTRSTLPSTAATGRPKQMEATAPAVYSPTPGRASSPS